MILGNSVVDISESLELRKYARDNEIGRLRVFQFIEGIDFALCSILRFTSLLFFILSLSPGHGL